MGRRLGMDAVAPTDRRHHPRPLRRGAHASAARRHVRGAGGSRGSGSRAGGDQAQPGSSIGEAGLALAPPSHCRDAGRHHRHLGRRARVGGVHRRRTGFEDPCGALRHRRHTVRGPGSNRAPVPSLASSRAPAWCCVRRGSTHRRITACCCAPSSACTGNYPTPCCYWRAGGSWDRSSTSATCGPWRICPASTAPCAGWGSAAT